MQRSTFQGSLECEYHNKKFHIALARASCPYKSPGREGSRWDHWGGKPERGAL